MKPILWLATILLENTWDSLLAVPAPFLELERAKLSPFPINRPNFFYGRDLRDPVSRIIIWLRNLNESRSLNRRKQRWNRSRRAFEPLLRTYRLVGPLRQLIGTRRPSGPRNSIARLCLTANSCTLESGSGTPL